MSSPLRNSMSASSLASPILRSTSQSPSSPSPRSLARTYYIASSARTKLMHEAGQPDHNLHRLVGHANLLDNLMLDLSRAEAEQESRYNIARPTSAVKPASEPRHVQWADAIPEEMDDEDLYEDASEDDVDSDDEQTSQPEDDDDDDDDVDDQDLTLTRTTSHQVPELTHDDDSESEEESMPPSPTQPDIPLDAFSEKQRRCISSPSIFQCTVSIPSTSSSSLFGATMQTAIEVC